MKTFHFRMWLAAGFLGWMAGTGGCADSAGSKPEGVATKPVAETLPAGVVRWVVDNVEVVGGNKVQVLGVPKVVDAETGGGKAVGFDGVRDGMILPVVPVAGMKSFTLEVLFRPESGGPAEQRFMHSEDEAGNRFTVETRLVEKNWYLDTFLLAGGTGGGRRTLIDATKLHPADQWYWVALRYDGTTMSDFVNGVKEGEGPVVFGPMGANGRVSLGVRLNQVNWFKGQIKEVRVTPRAVAEGELQKVGAGK